MKKNIIIVVIVILAVLFFGVKRNILSPATNTSTPTSSLPAVPPFLYAPQPGAGGNTIFLKSSQTVVVQGKVPAGWMFEGQLQIKLLDQNRKVIATGIGKELLPGSWQSGKAADFEGSITFKTNAKTGYLVIEADNPSGDPKNDKVYEVPVEFITN